MRNKVRGVRFGVEISFTVSILSDSFEGDDAVLLANDAHDWTTASALPVEWMQTGTRSVPATQQFVDGDPGGLGLDVGERHLHRGPGGRVADPALEAVQHLLRFERDRSPAPPNEFLDSGDDGPERLAVDGGAGRRLGYRGGPAIGPDADQDVLGCIQGPAGPDFFLGGKGD